VHDRLVPRRLLDLRRIGFVLEQKGERSPGVLVLEEPLVGMARLRETDAADTEGCQVDTPPLEEPQELLHVSLLGSYRPGPYDREKRTSISFS
jgi:hypothetical protein